MMTSRERLIAAARRQDVDAIPISPRLGVAVTMRFGSNTNIGRLRLKRVYDYDPHLDVTGNSYPFTDPLETFRSCPGVHVRIDVRDTGPTRLYDRTIVTPDGTLHEVIVQPNPGRSEYGLSPNPTRVEHMVKSEEDIPRVAHLMPAAAPELAREYHDLEAVAGEEALVRAVIYGPIDHAAGELMSVEDMMVSWLTNRSFAERFVGMFTKQVMEQTRIMCEAGVRSFFIPYYWHSLSVGWSPAIFEEWFLPMIAEQVRIIHAYEGLAFYYDDGKMMRIIPFLISAGVDVVETCTPPPVGDFELDEAKRAYGDRICFMGYTDLIYVLQRGTAEDVRRTVEISCRVGGRGFILGTSDSMREGTSRRNVDTYFASGRRYGRLPR